MKFISKTLPDVFLSTLKTEFDAIAEDCSLLNVSVSGEYTLILTIDTDLVVTLACTNSSTFGSATSIAFNGTVLYTKSCAVGYNPVIRVLDSESFFFLPSWHLPFFLFSALIGYFYQKHISLSMLSQTQEHHFLRLR